ncbi:MAG: GNAT family N-acetyltransferase [Pseudomonadota bacterium]|nr:GNAT family N-acetyltransferase [Pseudomonadota bacterium]
MTSHTLDNPFWSSLRSRHRELALCAGEVARFPAEMAPFLGIAHVEAEVSDAIESLVAPGESVYLLGVAPGLPDLWQLEAFRPLAQMICAQTIAIIDGPEVIELTQAHRADVLALTALVYPHYFRERTMALGRYFGIYQEGRLAAMIGERLATLTHQEISAVCTHPDFNGRGFARRLVARLSNDNLDRGRIPFLHVSHENLRAKTLYEQMGFHVRRDIPFWSLRRRVDSDHTRIERRV